MAEVRYTEGTLSKRGGKWQASVTYGDPVTGSRRRKSKIFDLECEQGGKEVNRRKAEQLMHKWRDRLLQDDRVRALAEEEERRCERNLVTVGDWVTTYVNRRASEGSIEPSTVTGYYATAKRIKADPIASVRVVALTRNMIQDFEARLVEDGLSASTVRKAYRLLDQSMREAVLDEIIETPPTFGVRQPKLPHRCPNSLTASGRASLVAHLREAGMSPMTVAAWIALFTGLRRGEVCGLRWRDVSLDDRMMLVTRSIGEGRGGSSYIKGPKTHRTRDVPIAGQLAGVLSVWYAQCRDEWGLTDGEMFDLYVIGNAEGGFCLPTYITEGWRVLSRGWNLVGTAGRRVTFHDLRHTFATAAIVGGLDVKTVSSILGHSSAAMTLDIYASADPDAKRAAADRIDALIVV